MRYAAGPLTGQQMHFHRVKRRDFITLLGGAAAAWPLAARAQQPARLPLVAILRSEVAGDSEGLRNTAALVQGLQALGWTEGRNIRIEQRWAGGSVGAMKALARELVALGPDVIVVISTPVTAAVMQETNTIPIIFLQNFDPVGSGFVKSLAAPGGNITGFTSYEPAMASKWLELLKEVAPQAARVAIMYNPQTAPYAGARRGASPPSSGRDLYRRFWRAGIRGKGGHLDDSDRLRVWGRSGEGRSRGQPKPPRG